MTKIPKHFPGHAAYGLRALVSRNRNEMLSGLAFDPASDGPEVAAIRFFTVFPDGSRLPAIDYRESLNTDHWGAMQEYFNWRKSCDSR